MSPTARFVEIVREDPLRLDEAVFLIAAHDHAVDVDAQLGRLDELADGVDEPTLDGLCRHLFGELGFRGDDDTYDDPDNSFLDRVLDRRLGLPIALSVLVMEVGRRIGVPTDGVGMPGHFLLRDRVDPEVFIDPFHGGVELDAAACRERLRTIDPTVAWNDEYLEPVAPSRVLARILANLQASFRRRQRRRDGCWAAQLATLLPGAGPRETLVYVGALAEAGAYDHAAETAEQLAARLDPASAEKLQAAARRYSAKLN